MTELFRKLTMQCILTTNEKLVRVDSEYDYGDYISEASLEEMDDDALVELHSYMLKTLLVVSRR